MLLGYHLQKKIGEGSFGNVCEIVRLSDNHVFACKFQSKKKTVDMYGGNLARAIKRVRSEIDFAKTLSHPNIGKKAVNTPSACRGGTL